MSRTESALPTIVPSRVTSPSLLETTTSHDSWRMLLAEDRDSDKFPQLAKEILEKRSKFDAFQFTDIEAAQLIELIEARILQDSGILNHLKCTALSILRRLCGTFGQLPNSCSIGDELEIDDGLPLATHPYADLQRGTRRGEDVAIKFLRFAAGDDRAKITKRFCKEMVLWKQLRHPNILPFYGACMADRFGMVFPWMENGNIVEFTRKNPEVNRLRLLIDVAKGLKHLHIAGVTHGNLKGSNVLVCGSGSPRALLSDYGLTSVIFDPFSLTKASMSWIAPELFSIENDRDGPSPPSDIYALAMVIFEVLTGAPPFAGQQGPEFACQVTLEGKRPPRPNSSETLGITDEIWDLLELCWTEDVSSRPEVNHVVGCLERAEKHEKAQKIADELDKALNRIGVCNDSRRYLRCLQNLCGAFGILPISFALTGKLERIAEHPSAGGGSANVYKAIYEEQAVAVKVLRIYTDTDPKDTRMGVAKEVVGWKWFRHDNLLPFLGVTSAPQQFSMVSPWMENGNIMRFLKDHPEQNPFRLLVDVTNGLQYLHDHDFVHGDLKGANILIDPEYRARLADFGFARIIENSCSWDAQKGHATGTIRWSAPECLHPEMFGYDERSGKRLPSKSTDIYALGMTILEVITRRSPFPQLTDGAMIMHVLNGHRPDRPAVGFSDALWKLLEKSWRGEHKRPHIFTLRAQLGKDGGISGAAVIVADGPSSLVSGADPDSQVWLERAQELISSMGPAAANQVPPQEPRENGVRANARRQIQKFRDRFRQLLDKFARACQGPITLSRGLVPEREENAEYGEGLFGQPGHVQSDGGLAPV